MKEKIKTFLAICILVLTVPYVVTFLFQGNETSVDSKAMKNILEQDSFEKQKAEHTDLDMEEYLVGILAKEIPLDYELEAVKAQAVIDRTSLAAALENGEGELPASMSREEMLKLWGQNGFEQNYQMLEAAAEATAGEVMYYDGKPIHAAFHAVSAGKTRDAREALQREDEPYLAQADSAMDIPSPDFLKVIFMEKEEFYSKLKEACPELEAAPENILESVVVETRDSSGYVTQVKIGEKTVAGEEFRGYLGLNSACFSLKEVENKVRIVTKGLGHGLGLSQYGANELAKEGKNYKEILKHYYKDISIEK